MTIRRRFGDYQRVPGAGHNEVSLNRLQPELETESMEKGCVLWHIRVRTLLHLTISAACPSGWSETGAQ